ncbi:restriction endonuclease subunit S [Staphylococcus aureus]|uniref:restriction endonuclease subunit S n=2 Tax=Staphylococcus aureus TaxID=1280 RepID=UPI00085CAEB4|nr:restriction endonuclease subunit S [Staphylococcus aureus]EJX2394231.1 restriction endonuclease subunit S [Staphylococcus aureus]ELL5616050.1 restriction endonuclease subunit S [Staphylococcus aureus]MBZ5474572.1 restriction endonuclease subunit S [Staphylococcus aureus]MCQ1243867.1 restriction endonuclease subunit S [Staphylococcus aureus]MCQ1249149.1 restriction endonuclease subunit S [Staphylococcus aureus]
MSNTQKKNVPELRFPGFEGEWEEKKLGDLTDRVIRKNKNLESKKPLTISGQLGLIDQTEYFSKSVSSKNLENYTLIKNGEFAYNKSYSNGYPLGAIKRLTRYDSGVLSSLYICFSIKSEMSKDFMEAYFDSTHWYREVSGIAVEGARNHGLLNVSVNDFFTILIKYPSLEEQQKIGKFFSKLDRQIELEEQKLELLQQQKKCYMQKIFSQELRFKDENGEDYPDWKEKKLGDITEQSMYGIGASATRFDSKNIYIRITDIDEKSRKLNYQNLTTPDELNNKYKLKRNDILFARTGASTGKSYIHKEEKDIYNYYFAGFLIKFEIDEQNNPLFIYQFTLTSKFNKWVKVMSVRSGQPGINSEEYAKLPLVLPNKLEQKKIAEFLDRFDQQIELEKQKIEILQQQKKGLLQSMFI